MNQDIATDERIQALSDEAGEAGDLDQVDMCQRALAGNRKARRACARVIAAGVAQSEQLGIGSDVPVWQLKGLKQ